MPGPRSDRCSSSICERMTASSSMGTHWNGVCGLGTSVLTPMRTLAFFPSTRWPAASTSLARSAIACTSSSVCVGWPIMKYILSRPAALVDLLGCGQQVGGGDRLVDHVAAAGRWRPRGQR